MFENYWLAGSPRVPLTVIYLLSGGSLTVGVTECELSLQGDLSPTEQFVLWGAECNFASYASGRPAELASLAIPKPWGQEIWYTGVEDRGVCCFEIEDRQTPIPWLQAVIPDAALGVSGEPLVLLKILDPVAEPVIGDLYFELHEEKQEVYVVTHIDRNAWPDGTGYIRIGFDEAKLASHAGDDAAFREAYLGAVHRYEAVRRKIDGLPEGMPSGELQTMEAELRSQMDSYSHLRPLCPGDVVKVPLLTPHALQHGVRTVEFQTPVYERKILSFAQKVLTQDHWDTEEAVAQMQLEPVEEEAFDCLVNEDDLRVERIVDFSDFEVRRVCLAGGGSLDVEPLPLYGLIMVVDGELEVAGSAFGPEQAFILPRGWAGQLAALKPASSLVFLLAFPCH
jgi:hypothetical protein